MVAHDIREGNFSEKNGVTVTFLVIGAEVRVKPTVAEVRTPAGLQTLLR
jgi:hypothetical protein